MPDIEHHKHASFWLKLGLIDYYFCHRCTGNQSNAATSFVCSTWKPSEIFIRISSQAHCLAIKRSHAMVMKVRAIAVIIGKLYAPVLSGSELSQLNSCMLTLKCISVHRAEHLDGKWTKNTWIFSFSYVCWVYLFWVCAYFYSIVYLFRPINGQMEIVGVSNSYQATEWKTSEGIFINPSEDIKASSHTELWTRSTSSQYNLGNYFVCGKHTMVE